jgi:hypothetical protein
MKLTSRQLDKFEREGYLFYPGLFAPEEIIKDYDVELPWKDGPQE